MRSIRKFAYAATLGLSMLAIQPTLAAAEDARGSFSLTHEVQWQNIVLRPGDYSFSIKTMGRPTYLVLRGLGGNGTTAMVLVRDIEEPVADEATRLNLVSIGGKSFVSSMDLPRYDMNLRFAVPEEVASK